jgi:hypothetical protein
VEGVEGAPVFIKVDTEITNLLKTPALKAEFQASERKALGIVVGVGKVASLGGGSSLMLNPTASVLRFSGLASPRLSYYSCITKHELRQGTCQKRFPDAGWTQKDE